MPRCRKCSQIYTGAFHINCPGTRPEIAPRPSASQNSAPLITIIPPAGPPAAPAKPQAQGNSPFGASNPRLERAITPQPALPPVMPAVIHPPRVAAEPIVAAPPAAGSAGSRAGYHCTVSRHYQSEERRPANNAMIAAMLGVALIAVALVAYNPCLLILLALAIYVLRWRVFRVVPPMFRLVFPGGTIPAWHYDVFDHDRNLSYSVIILDPSGVAPADHSRVLVRGRMRRNHFLATHILREFDPNGVPVLGQDGLIARQSPPIWLGAGLLAAGVLLCLPLWLR